MERWLWIVCWLIMSHGCSSDPETGASIERVVSGDWSSRFADDPSAHLVSLPPGQSYFDTWVYQFGSSPSEWATGNMECGPACVSILERLSGQPGTSCAYRSRIDGCPVTVHSECRQTGVCGRSSGFASSSARGTSVYQMRDVLDGLGFTTRVISGSGSDRMSLSMLQRAIDDDHPMVVTVNACAYAGELSLGVCSRSHFVIAYGYSDSYVYILDPGYRNGQRARISIDAFNRAISLDPSGVEVTRPGFERFPNATWYPPGTLLRVEGEYYYVVDSGTSGSPRVWHASAAALEMNRLSVDRAIQVSRDVVGCFDSLGELDPTPHFREYREETGEIYLVDTAARERYVFLNYEAYLSHRGLEEWVTTSSSEISEWSSYPLAGTLGFAPGTLIASQEPGVSTVWVVSYNARGRLRLPIFNEDTARVYGYDISAIGSRSRSARVPARDLDLLAGPEGEILRIELARDCGGRHCLTAEDCFMHSSPGGIDEAEGNEREDVPPSPSGDAGVQMSPDAGTSSPVDSDGDGQPDGMDCAPSDPTSYGGAVELCDNRDNDCNGIPDDGISDRTSRNACGDVTESCLGGFWRMILGREPEPERCNGGDDDCDGSVDEGVCAPPPPDPPPSSSDPSRIRVTLSPSVQSECAGGYVMRLWGAGTNLVSTPGATLDGSVAGWSGWSGLTLTCPSGGWHNWAPSAGLRANEAGISSILLGDTDITTDVLICTEPWNPSGGPRPVIAWNASDRGRCP